MKLGELRIVKIGRNLFVRFPVKVCRTEDAALMAGMWMLENYVNERCSDKMNSLSLIMEGMRKHIMEGKE